METYKNPNCKKVRGSHVLEVSCAYCKCFIANYQKVGESNFVKMYNDRIINGSIDFSQYHGAIFCPNCGERIAPRGTSPRWTRKRRTGLSHQRFIRRRCKMPDFIGKSKTAYNKKADDYENTPEGRFTREFQWLIASEIVLRENDNVLDVACGTDSLLAALNEKTPINGFGVDISERMIANAVTKNPGMGFYVSRCEAMPFGDASMDVITVCAAYHHFPNPSAFAKESARVIKPNGRIYIAEIYLPSFLRVIVNPFVPLSKEGDVRFYSPKEIHRNFKQVGFDSVDVKISGHIQIVSMKYKEQPL